MMTKLPGVVEDLLGGAVLDVEVVDIATVGAAGVDVVSAIVVVADAS